MTVYADALWTEASHDHEAAHDAEVMGAAQVAGAEVWSVLASAEHEADFYNRLALLHDNIHAVAASIAPEGTPDYTRIVTALPERYFEDWHLLAEARRKEAQTRNAPRAAARAEAREQKAAVGSSATCFHCHQPIGPGDAGYKEEWGDIQIHDACQGPHNEAVEAENLAAHQKWWDAMDPEFRKGYEDMGFTRDKRKIGSRVAAVNCSCASNSDGTTTTMLCPLHAKEDPCWTMASVTGKRRKGSIINGTCTNCGWSESNAGVAAGQVALGGGLGLRGVWAKQEQAEKTGSIKLAYSKEDYFELARAYLALTGTHLEADHQSTTIAYALNRMSVGEALQRLARDKGHVFSTMDALMALDAATQRTSSLSDLFATAAQGWWSEGVLGKQYLGFPGSTIIDVEPTETYLMEGPSSNIGQTPDFIVTVKKADGTTFTIGKQYAWLQRQQGASDSTVTATIEHSTWVSADGAAEAVPMEEAIRRATQDEDDPVTWDEGKKKATHWPWERTAADDGHSDADCAVCHHPLWWNPERKEYVHRGEYGDQGHKPVPLEVPESDERYYDEPQPYPYYSAACPNCGGDHEGQCPYPWLAQHDASKRTASGDNSWPPKEGGEKEGGDPKAPPAAPGAPQTPEPTATEQAQPGQPGTPASGITQGTVLLDAVDGVVATYEVNSVTDEGETMLVSVTKNGGEQMDLRIPKTEMVQTYQAKGDDATAPVEQPEGAPSANPVADKAAADGGAKPEGEESPAEGEKPAGEEKPKDDEDDPEKKKGNPFAKSSASEEKHCPSCGAPISKAQEETEGVCDRCKWQIDHQDGA